VPFARVVDGEAFGAEVREEKLDLGNYGADRGDVVPLMDKVAFWRADWGHQNYAREDCERST